MTLTDEQCRAAALGQNVRFTLDGVEFVLMRFDLLEKMKAAGEHDHEELRMMLARSSERNGWDDPGMDAYDSYPAKP